MQENVKSEKKVEYLELIYDLIFVFVIGRNNNLLHHFSDGFIEGRMFIAYTVCTLAVIQFWSLTTYYINIFGRNGLREHISLFFNMFMMYFIAEGTTADYEAYYVQYHIAWALIIANTGLQYLIELRNHRDDKELCSQIKLLAAPLFAEAALVLCAIPASAYLDLEISWVAIAFGIAATVLTGKKSKGIKVDFPHLTERAMLYVVFTFGEMIIGLSGYFEGSFDLSSFYFSVMGFLITAGLFVSYETLYDHIVDREQRNGGLGYMMIHVFLIFSMNNITSALEFMREDEIALMPKMLFLVGSLLLFFICLFLLGLYAKKRCSFRKGFILKMSAAGALFALLMVLLREYMKLNILLTVIFVFAVFLILHRIGKVQKAGEDTSKE